MSKSQDPSSRLADFTTDLSVLRLSGMAIIIGAISALVATALVDLIGTGGPFGAEGPIIMTGGAFGSLFAQFFHLSSAERKTLLVAGAAEEAS